MIYGDLYTFMYCLCLVINYTLWGCDHDPISQYFMYTGPRYGQVRTQCTILQHNRSFTNAIRSLNLSVS